MAGSPSGSRGRNGAGRGGVFPAYRAGARGSTWRGGDGTGRARLRQGGRVRRRGAGGGFPAYHAGAGGSTWRGGDGTGRARLRQGGRVRRRGAGTSRRQIVAQRVDRR